MVSKKLVPVIIGLKVFVFLIIFFCLVSPQAAISNITPDRIITIVADKPEVPEWKTLWDEARKNVQENNYQNMFIPECLLVWKVQPIPGQLVS